MHTKDIKTIFADALERPSAEEQAAYVKEACGSDGELRSRIETLLESHREAGGFFFSVVGFLAGAFFAFSAVFGFAGSLVSFFSLVGVFFLSLNVLT